MSCDAATGVKASCVSGTVSLLLAVYCMSMCIHDTMTNMQYAT